MVDMVYLLHDVASMNGVRPVAAATAQLNVRMDSRLRAAGDAVLERVGVTPADVVRALWAKIADGVQDCEQVLALLQEEKTPTAPSRGDECLAAIDGWHSELFSCAKVDRTTYVAPSDEELGEMLYDEWLARDSERATL